MEWKDLIRLGRARYRPKKLSQADLAKLLGVNKSAVAQWETGATNPKQEYKLLLRQLLKLDNLGSLASEPRTLEFTEDPDEIALLEFWRSLESDADRLLFAKLLKIDNIRKVG